MEYTVDYYINKFEAIPEELWGTGKYRDKDDKCCALGHCGQKAGPVKLIEEAKALDDLIISYYKTNVIAINDGSYRGTPETNFMSYGDTPKQRILTALRQIKDGKVIAK
jgi:hypothetical protein